MPFPRTAVNSIRKYFRSKFLYALALAAVFVIAGESASQALSGGEPIHFSGDKEVWDRKANHVELKGHAAVVQFGESLSADEISINFKSRLLVARGNCVYSTESTAIWGDEMRFNIDTREGEVVRGRVSNDRFTLRGGLIHRLGEGRFKTQWGEYTTCADCAPSWTILAEEVDMQTEGYAFFKNVTPRVKDSPIFWFPYLFMPMKTKRQSGVLFPSFTFGSTHGVTFVLPYFWAIDRNADMTLGVGYYGNRGLRLQTEGRYILDYGSGVGNFFFNRDAAFYNQFQFGQSRWGFTFEQNHQLPFGIQEKLSLAEVGDTYYPYYFSDVRGGNEVFLSSMLAFSRSSDLWSASLQFERNRNLLRTDGLLDHLQDQNATLRRLTVFDPRTVQALPRFGLSLPEQFLGTSHLVGGLSLSVVNFSRGGNWFDYDTTSVPFGATAPASAPPFRPGVDPIREAVRLSLSPSVYTHFRPWDRFSVVPSLQYRNYFYQFGGGIRPLHRGYLLLQTDFVTQIEKIYEFPEDPNVSKTKHLFRPFFTHSFIPNFTIAGDDRGPGGHPFVRQIYNNGQTGYNFDDNDITPLNATQNAAQYFNPLGHSLSYGFASQWIQRKKPSTPGAVPDYHTAIDIKAGHVINFRELTDPVNPLQPRPFARLFSELHLNFDRWDSQTIYSYLADQVVDGAQVVNPNIVNLHQFSTSFAYVLEKSVRQGILTFDRSLNLSYVYSGQNPFANNLSLGLNYSISDYFLPSISVNYRFTLPNAGRLGVDQAGSQFLGASAGLTIQSPSRCWKVVLNASYIPGPQGISFFPDFSINLVGTGFGNVGSFVGQAAQATGG
jgi:hypothetical protein